MQEIKREFMDTLAGSKGPIPAEGRIVGPKDKVGNSPRKSLRIFGDDFGGREEFKSVMHYLEYKSYLAGIQYLIAEGQVSGPDPGPVGRARRPPARRARPRPRPPRGAPRARGHRGRSTPPAMPRPGEFFERPRSQTALPSPPSPPKSPLKNAFQFIR